MTQNKFLWPGRAKFKEYKTVMGRTGAIIRTIIYNIGAGQTKSDPKFLTNFRTFMYDFSDMILEEKTD